MFHGKLLTPNYKLKLIEIFYQSIKLRKMVSYSVRIVDVNQEDIDDMKKTGRELFISCCLFDTKITPSMWNLTNVAPHHAEECLVKFGYGLGINTMEGREQKHQKIKIYSEKATYQKRWSYIFRHEFIQLVYLRRRGFDNLKYRKCVTTYIPEPKVGCCDCSLELVNGVCMICHSDAMKEVVAKVDEFLN